MQNCWDKFYKENKAIVWAAIVSILLILGILLKVKDEVTRFTLVMPVFAGFILFSILATSDEELEEEGEREEEEISKETKKEKKKKKSSRK